MPDAKSKSSNAGDDGDLKIEVQEDLSRIPSFTQLLQTWDSPERRPKKNGLMNPSGLAMSAVAVHGNNQPVVTGKRKKRERRMQTKSRLMVFRVSSACSQRIGVESGA